MIGSEYELDRTYEDGRQFEDDKKLLVKFEIRAVKNEYKSKQEARPVFDDTEYIHIIVPGSRDVNIFPLDDSYKARFRERYEKWKSQGDVELSSGTILAEVPWLSKSQIAELNYSNIRTIEQLAGMSDVLAQKFMGNNELRMRAKRYLEAAAGAAPMLKMEQELKERDSKIEVLTQSLEAMKVQLDRLTAAKK